MKENCNMTETSESVNIEQELLIEKFWKSEIQEFEVRCFFISNILDNGNLKSLKIELSNTNTFVTMSSLINM